MRRLLICAAILLVCATVPAVSDMVLVHLYGQVPSEHEGSGEVERLLSAMEDGVMREFFEAGHIVFNTVDRNTYLAADDAVDAGNSQDADWVVVVDTQIQREDEKLRIDAVRSRFLDVEGEEVYLDYNLNDEVFARRSNESREEAARRAGAEIGTRLIESF